MPQKRSKKTAKPARKPGPRPKRGSKPVDVESDSDEMTLRRFLAASGLDSRRNCDEYILAERITIDGQVVTEPSVKVNPSKQRICVDGERAKLEPKRYYLLNKPKGYLCTNRDPRGRRRAVDLVTAPGIRLFTVGRLDENSEGLLLVTNDGDLANKLAHPRYQVRRKYRVQVAGIPKQATLLELKKGLHFKDGRFRLHGAKRLKTQGKSSFLEIEMREGQNREIRRLMARVGHKVMQLQRVEFGPLKLGRIASGKSRPLKPPEIKQLRKFVDEMEEVRRKPSSPRRAAKQEPGEKPAPKKSTGEDQQPKPEAKTKTVKGRKPASRKKAVTKKPARKKAKASSKPAGWVEPKRRKSSAGGKKKR
ncbi:MAG: pseudouridine synthase [Planctomycetaceae bacterium]